MKIVVGVLANVDGVAISGTVMVVGALLVCDIVVGASIAVDASGTLAVAVISGNAFVINDAVCVVGNNVEVSSVDGGNGIGVGARKDDKVDGAGVRLGVGGLVSIGVGVDGPGVGTKVAIVVVAGGVNFDVDRAVGHAIEPQR